MKYINLNTEEGVKLTLFPDNQPSVTVTQEIAPEDRITLTVSLTNANRVLNMLQIANVIDRKKGIKSRLCIPYLMAARSDRVFAEERSFDLKVICELINSMNFEHVLLLDPHSDVAPALINNSYVITNQFLVEEYKQENAVLIVPDAGAAKKAHEYQKWNPNIKEIVHCVKHRNIETGALEKIEVLEPGTCTDRNCVIIDDLCDAGGTFIGIANQIDYKHLTLIVTHGLFTKGFKELDKAFDEIISTNSYEYGIDSNKLRKIKSPIE